MHAETRIWTPPVSRPFEAIDARVRIVGIADQVRIALELEGGTRWEIDLSAAAGAYLAGRMAMEAGVRFASEGDPR